MVTAKTHIIVIELLNSLKEKELLSCDLEEFTNTINSYNSFLGRDTKFKLNGKNYVISHDMISLEHSLRIHTQSVLTIVFYVKKVDEESTFLFENVALTDLRKYKVIDDVRFRICKHNKLDTLYKILLHYYEFKTFANLAGCATRSNDKLIELCNKYKKSIDPGVFKKKTI